jgi:integrase
MAKSKLKDTRLFWRDEKSRYIWTRLPGGRRESTKCTSERAAVAYANRREREIADPRIARSQATRWDDSVIDLLDELRRRGRAPATIDKNERKLAHYPRVWGSLDAPAVDMAIGDIDADKVNTYIDQRLSEGVARITIRDELVALGQLLKLQRRAKRYPYDVAEVLPVQWETGHKPRSRWLSRTEYEALREALPEGRRAHLDYSIAIGGRMSEVPRAQWGDIGDDDVLVRGSKTEGSWKRIPLTAITRPLIMSALAHAPIRPRTGLFSGPMFRPWLNINRDLKKACKAAGIPPVSTNDLRRTFGHWHAEAGIPAALIAPMLRHTTDKLAQTTYARPNVERTGRLVAEHLAGVLNVPSAQQQTPDQPHQPQAESCQNFEEDAPPVRFERTASALGKPELSDEVPEDWRFKPRGVPEVDVPAPLCRWCGAGNSPLRQVGEYGVIRACDVCWCSLHPAVVIPSQEIWNHPPAHIERVSFGDESEHEPDETSGNAEDAPGRQPQHLLPPPGGPEEGGASSDTVPREPGCQCHWEVGDSPCPVHPTCEGCGEPHTWTECPERGPKPTTKPGGDHHEADAGPAPDEKAADNVTAQLKGGGVSTGAPARFVCGLCCAVVPEACAPHCGPWSVAMRALGAIHGDRRVMGGAS